MKQNLNILFSGHLACEPSHINSMEGGEKGEGYLRSPTEGLNMARLEVDDSEPSGFVGLFVVKPQNVNTYFQVLGEMQGPPLKHQRYGFSKVGGAPRRKRCMAS